MYHCVVHFKRGGTWFAGEKNTQARSRIADIEDRKETDLQDWREQWAGAVHNPDDFVRFIDSVGCCMRLPMPRYPGFPNQQEAMGELDANVPDPWFWKDDLHAEKRIYYT
jgi:hypothetical protein